MDMTLGMTIYGDTGGWLLIKAIHRTSTGYCIPYRRQKMRTKILPILFAVAVVSAVAIGSVANDVLPPSNVEQQLPPTIIHKLLGPVTFPEISHSQRH